jgi:hypothetical protein
MLFDYLALAFFIFFVQETEKKRKIEKMKQKRWQEKHRQFMFGLSPDDDKGDGNGDGENESFLGPPLRLNDRPLSRPPSIVSLQSKHRTESPIDTPRKSGVERRESGLGLSQFLTSKLLKEKREATMKDADTPSVSDSDAGSVEGSYDVRRESSPHDSASHDLFTPPTRDRALSVPVIVTPQRFHTDSTRDDIEEEDEDKEVYSTKL